MENQKTLVVIKPDAFRSGVWYKVIQILKNQGLRIVLARFLWSDREMMEDLYAEHKDKPFFNLLIDHMMSGLNLALCLEGQSAVSKSRATCLDIREIYASRTDLSANVVHGSDSFESAQREIQVIFGDNLN